MIAMREKVTIEKRRKLFFMMRNKGCGIRLFN